MLSLGNFHFACFFDLPFWFLSFCFTISLCSVPVFCLTLQLMFSKFFLHLVPDVVDEAVLDKDESSSDDRL